MSGNVVNVVGSVQGLDRVAFALNLGIPQSVRATLRQAVDRLGLELQRRVKADYLSGSFQTGIGRAGALNVQTGTLRRSINLKREDTSTTVAAFVGTNVVYGRAWELGNVPRFGPGRTIIGRQAARPFLRPAWEEMRPKVQAELTKAIGFALRRGAMLGP
jgi:phage gpG-like protein